LREKENAGWDWGGGRTNPRKYREDLFKKRHREGKNKLLKSKIFNNQNFSNKGGKGKG